jgi:hydroxymethylpyrimidine/phosphomethylpyrimidine kinase
MVAKGGALLLADSAVGAMKDMLLPRAALITPNLPEASVLVGRSLTLQPMTCAPQSQACGTGPARRPARGGRLETGDIARYL